VAILTRAGAVRARVGSEQVAVEMPMPVVGGPATVLVSGVELAGTTVRCGNPNLVCRVPDPSAVDLGGPLMLDPVVFPEGANVELVGPEISTSDGVRVAMRVVERGVGETLSCGSGACAAAAAVLAGATGTVEIDVPGGRLTVELDPDRCVLTGPAVIVAAGQVRLDQL
jgi:diaminopimelate epimerase